MNTVLQILYTVLIFGVLVFVHEFGHFITAKIFNVRVTEFALGMGPAIFKKQGKETLYSLRILPFGGYCAMTGEDEAVEGDDRAMKNKPVWQRMIIVLAGAFMNLILGIILVAVVVCATPQPSTIVGEFAEGATSPAGGLQVNDKILAVDGKRISDYSELRNVLAYSYNKDTFSLTVSRNGQEFILQNVVFPTAEIGEDLKSATVDFRVYPMKKTFGVIMQNIYFQTVSHATSIFRGLVDLITGKISLKYVSGPIGISSVISEAAAYGWESLFSLAALISINLSIMNLLPIPSLDGGRFFFMLIEAIIRRPIPPKVEGIIHAIGLLLMFGLLIVITFKDIFFPIY